MDIPVVCAWCEQASGGCPCCHVTLGTKEVAWKPNRPREATHGICLAHKAMVLAELSRRRVGRCVEQVPSDVPGVTIFIAGPADPCPFCVGRIGRVVTTCEDCCGSGVARKNGAA